jgi:EmrB/QacA subfamily drug resistance transporter
VANPDACDDRGMPEPVPESAKVGRREFLQLFVAVMLPMFLAAVDQTLLATASAPIATELGGLRDVAWISIGYLMAVTVMIPVYGRLGDRYGRRDVLLVALGVYLLGAIACGFAASLGQLVAGRVLQGLGGGGLMVMSQALIGELIAPRERARFQGYFALVFTFSSVSGPVLGGVIVSHLHWRWLFWGNLPIVAFAAWRLSRLPRGRRNSGAPGIRDLPGVCMFAVACVLTLLWVSQVGYRFGWVSVTSLAMSGAAALLWSALVVRERAHPQAFLPVELLRDRAIARLAGTVVCFAASMFAMVLFLPVYLQLGLGLSAAEAGVLLLPLTLGIVIGSTVSGRVIAHTGRPRRMPVIGLSVAGLAILAVALVPPSRPVLGVLCLLCGAGFGTVMPTAQIVVQTLAGRERLGIASATISLARSTGGALGSALFGALVFALLDGLDYRAPALVDENARAAVIGAFGHAFPAAALVAACGAWLASRVPDIEL